MLPKNKFDNTNLQKISSLTDDEIQPILFHLLEWIQDYNWPVAKEVLPLLLARQSLILPHLSQILNGNDIMWQYWVMELVVPRLTFENQQKLKPDIEQLTLLTQQDEDSLEIVSAAKNCLARLNTAEP